MRRLTVLAVLLLALLAPRLPAHAAGDSQVQVTDLLDTSFNVTWVTDQPVTGEVQYATSCAGATSGLTATAIGSGYTHLASLAGPIGEGGYPTGLDAGTQYYFVLNNGGQIDNNNGQCYTATTFPLIENISTPDTVTGTVMAGPSCTTPVSGALLTMTFTNPGSNGKTSLPQAALTSDTGSWAIVVGEATDGKGTLIEPEAGATLSISAVDGQGGTGSTKATYQSNPDAPFTVQPICLQGGVTNPTNTPTSTTSPLATATLASFATATSTTTATATLTPTLTPTSTPITVTPGTPATATLSPSPTTAPTWTPTATPFPTFLAGSGPTATVPTATLGPSPTVGTAATPIVPATASPTPPGQVVTLPPATFSTPTAGPTAVTAEGQPSATPAGTPLTGGTLTGAPAPRPSATTQIVATVVSTPTTGHGAQPTATRTPTRGQKLPLRVSLYHPSVKNGQREGVAVHSRPSLRVTVLVAYPDQHHTSIVGRLDRRGQWLRGWVVQSRRPGRAMVKVTVVDGPLHRTFTRYFNVR